MSCKDKTTLLLLKVNNNLIVKTPFIDISNQITKLRTRILKHEMDPTTQPNNQAQN